MLCTYITTVEVDLIEPNLIPSIFLHQKQPVMALFFCTLVLSFQEVLPATPPPTHELERQLGDEIVTLLRGLQQGPQNDHTSWGVGISFLSVSIPSSPIFQ